MAPSVSGSSPVILASVVIGTAMAPKATGAVLATRATDAALTGRIPTAMSMTAVTATGVPKPASASSRAPKQKAMRTAWTRWSGESDPNARRRTRSYPVSSVSRKIQIAVRTIQMMGNRPNAAPSLADEQGLAGGHLEGEDRDEQRRRAREVSPACHAFQRSAPSRTKRVSSGSAATRADRASDPATGFVTGWNMCTPLCGPRGIADGFPSVNVRQVYLSVNLRTVMLSDNDGLSRYSDLR